MDGHASLDGGGRWLRLELAGEWRERDLSQVLGSGRAEPEGEALGREPELGIERPAQVDAVLGLGVAEEAGSAERQARILEEVLCHVRPPDRRSVSGSRAPRTSRLPTRRSCHPGGSSRAGWRPR